MNKQIYKLVLPMNIMMIVFCLFLIPALEKNSAEYVITVVSAFINMSFFILIIIKFKKEKNRYYDYKKK